MCFLLPPSLTLQLVEFACSPDFLHHTYQPQNKFANESSWLPCGHGTYLERHYMLLAFHHGIFMDFPFHLNSMCQIFQYCSFSLGICFTLPCPCRHGFKHRVAVTEDLTGLQTHCTSATLEFGILLKFGILRTDS